MRDYTGGAAPGNRAGRVPEPDLSGARPSGRSWPATARAPLPGLPLLAGPARSPSLPQGPPTLSPLPPPPPSPFHPAPDLPPPAARPSAPSPTRPLVAYSAWSSASTRSSIYAGGLGVLAGDFIKSARDLGLPGGRRSGCAGRAATASSASAPTACPCDEFPTYARATSSPTRACASASRVRGARGRVRASGAPSASATRRSTCSSRSRRRGPLDHAAGSTTRGTDVRIAQEILLGVGGVRALRGSASTSTSTTSTRATRCSPARADRRAHGGAARRSPRRGRRRASTIVFTTHTPVTAGNEVHALARAAPAGRRPASCRPPRCAQIGGDPFNMTVAGLRLVARAPTRWPQLHGETARAHVGARRGRRADHRDHQRRPRADLAGPARARRGRRRRTRCGRRTSAHEGASCSPRSSARTGVRARSRAR